MDQSLISGVLLYQNKVFDELYHANTLIYATISSCQEKEFKSEYYGIPKDFIPMISNERNGYISLLTIASDKLKYVNKLNLNIEEKISSLH